MEWRAVLAAGLALVPACALLVGGPDDPKLRVESIDGSDLVIGLDDAGDARRSDGGDSAVCTKKPVGSAAPVLVTAQVNAAAIVADSTHLYWIAEAEENSRGTLFRSDKEGCNAQPIASDLQNPKGLAVDDDHVYFTSDFVPDAAAEHGLYRISKSDGGTPEQIDTSTVGAGFGALVLEGDHAFTTAERAGFGARIRRTPKASGTPCFVYIGPPAGPGGGRIGPVTSAQGTLYFFDHERQAIMESGGDCDAGATMFASTAGIGPVTAIVADDATVFWGVEYPDTKGNLFRLPRAQPMGTPKRYAANLTAFPSLTHDSVNVYYSTKNGNIYYASKTDPIAVPPIAILFDGPDLPLLHIHAVTQQGGALYWTGYETGQVRRRLLPP